MKIGIIGAGNVGGALGARWAHLGHEVVYGVRQPDNERTRAVVDASGPNARATATAEAAAFGEVVVLAIPYAALAGTLPSLGNLAGKVVIDAINNAGPTAGSTVVAAEVAAGLPGARVVKAFNTMGSNIMADTGFGALHADNYICGDDVQARAVAADLSRQLGFEVVDAGTLANAGLLEGLARLWIDLVYRQGMGRDIAFKLLRR